MIGNGFILRIDLFFEMRSHTYTTSNYTSLAHLRVFPGRVSGLRLVPARGSFDSSFCGCYKLRYCIERKISGSRVRNYGRSDVFRVQAMDDDSVGVASFHDWGERSGAAEYILSSSDGDDSDGEIILQPITDVDLSSPREKFHPSDDSITVTAHRFAMLGKSQKKNKTLSGVVNNVGLITFSILLLFLVDQCAWRVVRLPLAPFYLMRPFMTSAAIVACVGYICVPLFRILKLRSIRRNQASIPHSSKKGAPTMGGLYFVPIGALVAEVIVGFSSVEMSGVAAVTLAFAAIGLIDDFLSLKNNSGLSGWMRILLEIAVGSWFACWLFTTNVSSPYNMKMVVPFPAPLGLVCLGKFYTLLTSFCFVAMANGINLTDELDGLACGIAALVFIGMSISVLPICSDVAIFGASMAGACIGFLLHNRYKASISMGETGALALGAALAAMASCTGMFFPLFISSGILIIAALSVIIQVCVFKTTKFFRKPGFRFSWTELKLCGIKEPIIVAAAYIVTGVLMLFGAYVGLISV